MNIDPSQLVTRVRQRFVMSGTAVSAKWLVEIKMDGKWLPAGSGDTFDTYPTKEAAQAAETEMKKGGAS